MARRGKYHDWIEPEGLLKIGAWARDGLVDEQIAKNIGVVSSTFYEWKRKFPEISEALKRNKEIADIEVENALYKRALGYEYEEVTEEIVKDLKTGEARLVPVKRVTKQVAPDTTAQIFWLKNRKPKEWRDKQDISLDANVAVKIVDDIDG